MIRKLLLLLEGAVLLAGLLVAFIAWQQHTALHQPLTLSDEYLVEVAAGATPGGVLNRLEADGVLDGALWLRLYWRFNLRNQPLHSGEYRLTPGLKALDMLSMWRRGEVLQYSLTLVEGWNFRQVRAALARETRLDLTLSELSDAQLMERLGLPGLNPEGRFFPDTYRFVRGMSDFDLLKQAHARLEQVLARSEWQDAELAEGLMLKQAESPYLAGRRRGAWWKHKREPYRLDARTLEFKGVDDWGQKIRPDGGISAHPKVCPRTGDLLFFNYSKQAPFMHYGEVDRHNQLVHYVPVPHRARLQ